MAGRARTAKLVGILVLTAVAARSAILFWSPLPATLDGFFYARTLEEIVATGEIPTPIDWDRVVMASFLASVQRVLGVAPLRLLQPISGLVGATTVLLAVVLVRQVISTDSRRDTAPTHVAVLLAGGILAVDGLFVYRSGVPDEELLGLLFVPLVAYTCYEWVTSGRPRWAWLTAIVVVLLPLTHSLSAVLAVVVVVAIAVHTTSATWQPAVAARALASVVGGLGSLVGFYWLALARPELTLSYTDRLLAQPRLLGAWLLLLVVGLPWFVRTSTRIQRTAVGLNLLTWFGLLLGNAIAPVYVGTIPTPTIVLLLVAPLLVPVGLTALGVDRVANRSGRGAAVLALLAAPVVLINYFLTAGLTPDLFDALLRVQTFVHLPVAILAAAGVATWGLRTNGVDIRWRRWGRLVVIGVLVCAVLTAPLSVMALDTGTVPRTTTPDRFAGTGFASTHVPGGWASEDGVQRIAGLYYNDSVATQPVRTWAGGGRTPSIPVLATHKWTTRGVHLYPQAPTRVAPERYDEWRTSSHVVYTNGESGTNDGYELVLPAETQG